MATPAPVRITAGFTQDMNFQPLGLIGQPDPVFYATAFDDFMFYQRSEEHTSELQSH